MFAIYDHSAVLCHTAMVLCGFQYHRSEDHKKICFRFFLTRTKNKEAFYLYFHPESGLKQCVWLGWFG